MGRKTLGIVTVVFTLALGAAALEGQAVRVGGQVSYADDADLGIGPRLAIELPSIASGVWLVGSFDYFFPDDGFSSNGTDVDYWEINGNVLYTIELPNAPNVAPYLGAGINVARVSITSDTPADGSDTNVGLNVLGGLEFPLTGLTPFVELRLEIDGGEQFVVAGGIMFP